MALPTTISGISTAVACVGPFKPSATALLNQSFSNTSMVFGNEVVLGIGNNSGVSQTFSSSDTGVSGISSVNFDLSKHPSI